MSIAIDPQPLIDEAQCLECNIPQGYIWYAVLAALQDIANGDPVPTEPDEIIDEARCLYSCIPAGYVPYAILAAIQGISSNAVGCNSTGNGSPEGVVTASPGCTYLDEDIDSFWVKKTGVGNTGWLQLVV